MLPGGRSANAQSLHRDNIYRYFSSENYTNLDYIKRRQRAKDEHTTDEACPPPVTSIVTNPSTSFRHDLETKREGRNGITHRFGLRRPLSPSLTVDEIRKQSICHEEFADKPYSTVMSRTGPMRYNDCFPLLMARSSEAEDKDNTKVQTETRRMSMVTTYYTTGKIKLKGVSSDENIKLSVFPILHKDFSSGSEGDEDGMSDDSDDVFEDEQPPPVQMYRRMTITASSNTGILNRWNPGRRSSSVSDGVKRGNTNMAKLMGRQGPKVTRRRSMDSNAISAEHFRALQTIRERMRNSKMEEEEEEEDDGPLTEEDEYHLKHADSTMLHLDKNLHTLEKFLSHIESTLDDSDVSITGTLPDGKVCGLPELPFICSTMPSEDNTYSSESEDDEATFW